MFGNVFYVILNQAGIFWHGNFGGFKAIVNAAGIEAPIAATPGNKNILEAAANRGLYNHVNYLLSKEIEPIMGNSSVPLQYSLFLW